MVVGKHCQEMCVGGWKRPCKVSYVGMDCRVSVRGGVRCERPSSVVCGGVGRETIKYHGESGFKWKVKHITTVYCSVLVPTNMLYLG